MDGHRKPMKSLRYESNADIFGYRTILISANPTSEKQ